MITWDEPKRLANLIKHGLDFAQFESGFDFTGAIVIATSQGRSKVIGYLNGTLVAAIVGALGTEALALISLRPASRQEHELHGS